MECRKREEANHTETTPPTPPYLHEPPYAKIIEFSVDPAVSSIKFSKKIWLYNTQFCPELWLYSTIKVHYLIY